MARQKIDLRTLILGLTLTACVVTLANCLYAAYRIERQTLVERSLEANRAYSARVASSIDGFLREAQFRFQQAGERLADRFDDPEARHDALERLTSLGQDFDAVAIVNAEGRIVAALPETLHLEQRTVESPEQISAVRGRKPMVSNAYQSIAGNLVIFVSVPIFDRHGTYLGLIGGSIHLLKGGRLNELMSHHFFLTDSEVYVVDGRRQLLFHPATARIGSVAAANPATEHALSAGQGSVETVDAAGHAMLAGYASIPTAHWAIVSQQPLASVLAPVDMLMKRFLVASAPIAAIGFVLVWILTRYIARPLRQLADSTTSTGLIESTGSVAQVNAWYFEASHLKQALLHGIDLARTQVTGLELASQTDPLTGLLNRRALEASMAALEASGQQVAVIVLDIDHFKRVNDTYGHDVGDVVLQRLAEMMRQVCRSTDLAFRVGGEEFLMLLPDMHAGSAREAAERLRRLVEQTAIEPVGHITISLGVTTWPRDAASLAEALKEADTLMYQAKQAGRNRTAVAGQAVT
ncbi:sensor domain-containing diguanylate cyclase [Cupriavidus sp.]|uniref:sensor domain-containing diguanylate cyclase n=1 Tax=Cupriavidus sp. TaxID=1873897 RepID=UPI0031D26653